MYSTTQIFKEIERGKLKGSYLLSGEEEYLKEEGLKRLLAKMISEKETVFDKRTFYGDSVTPEEISSVLLSTPMMASKKVVIIRESHRLNTNSKNELLKYLANPLDSTYLILLAPRVDLGKGFFRKVSERTKVYLFKRLTRRERIELILSHLKKHRLAIAEDARELLLETVGSQTLKLIGELDKLISYKSGSRRIEKEDVEKLLDFGRLETIFRLQDLVGRRRLKEALAVIEQLLLWNEKPIRILGSLGSFYLTILKLKREPKNIPLESIATKFGLGSFYVKKCAAYLSSFTEPQLISALELTHQKELEMKEGTACFKPLLTAYINQLCTL